MEQLYSRIETTDKLFYTGVERQSVSAADPYTRVPCRPDTRDEVLRPLKRGGESYDDLLRKMAEQYDPDKETK